LIIEKELAKRESRGKILKADRTNKIDYIYVIFENNETKEEAIGKFKLESALVKYIKMLFCIKNQMEFKKKFLDHPLIIKDSLEPDEINWENLNYTEKDNRGR
jgi:hypothetical protein